MTTGRASVELSECSSQRPLSRSSAFSFSSSTTARRTVHTLIGSKVAFRTSTLPLVALAGDVSGPCHWCSVGDTDPTGAGGSVHSISAPECSGEPPGRRTYGGLSGRPRRGPRRAIRAEHAHLLAKPVKPGNRLVDTRFADAPLEIGEEDVAAELAPARPRLDLREVNVAAGA